MSQKGPTGVHSMVKKRVRNKSLNF